MEQSKEQTAALLTQILFSKLSHRFFDKYTEYEMQSDFLKDEIMSVYHIFLEKLNTQHNKEKK
jgi:flagellar motor switch protein FliG